jgi:hypothetical protein
LSTLQLRIFNEDGIREYQSLLETMNQEGQLLPVDELLVNDDYTVIIGDGVNVTVSDFASKEECGKYFHELFQKHELALKAKAIAPIGHRGLMTWLDAAWSPYVLKGSRGQFFVGELARHVYNFKPRVNYRHILGGPIAVYARLASRPELIRIVLNSGLTNNSDTYEQIAGRVQIVSDESALGLILNLYGSPSLGNELPGATASDELLPGGLRRFCTLHTQLEMNYDLRAMEPVSIATLLPEEFSGWVDGQPTKKKSRKSNVRKRAAKSSKVRAKRKTR